MFFAFIILLFIIPLVIAAVNSRSIARTQYAFNNASTNITSTTGSIICGNVGIGTFLAIYLFTQSSPVIGMAIVFSYSLGLVICGLVAKRIHILARKTDTYSLVDLICARHAKSPVLPIWMPVAFIFILRSAVQLSALALIIAEAFEIAFSISLIISTFIAGSYTFIGGYKAATETDLFQAVVIVVLMLVIAFGIREFELEQRSFFDLGIYKPFLLLGIFLFVPLSPILAVDNWQRIATSRDASVARNSYFIAAFICGCIYLLIWLVGMLPTQTGDVLQTFRTLMPAEIPWLADILFMTCILSSIDTFVMPLVTTFSREDRNILQLRLAVAAIFVCVGLVSYVSGDLLNSVIAAFNSLTVFLPAVLGSFLLKHPTRQAASISLNSGVLVTLVLTLIDVNTAAIGGFAFSAIAYLVAHKFAKSGSAIAQKPTRNY